MKNIILSCLFLFVIFSIGCRKEISNPVNNNSELGTPCPGVPTVTYAGKTYNTIQIGSQCWLKENLDVGIMINSVTGGTNSDGSQTNNDTIEKYCYDNDVNQCSIYGAFYQWDEAMQYVTTPGAKGICPTGWHIPTRKEYSTLGKNIGTTDDGGSSYTGGNLLKAIGQGSGDGTGTNTTGFSALLSGYRNYDGTFESKGSYTLFWSSTPLGTTSANAILERNYGNLIINTGSNRGGLSIRCIKD